MPCNIPRKENVIVNGPAAQVSDWKIVRLEECKIRRV